MLTEQAMPKLEKAVVLCDAYLRRGVQARRDALHALEHRIDRAVNGHSIRERQSLPEDCLDGGRGPITKGKTAYWLTKLCSLAMH